MLGELSASAVAVAAASGDDAFRFEAPLTTICDEVDTLRFIMPVDVNFILRFKNLNNCKFSEPFVNLVS